MSAAQADMFADEPEPAPAPEPGALSREPTMEQYAREAFGLPPDWRAFAWKAVGAYSIVTGAVVREKITKGKGVGQWDWKKRDRSTELPATISDEAFKKWLKAWELETGLCSKCRGTKQEWYGWSQAEGAKYRPCQPCGATGAPKVDD